MRIFLKKNSVHFLSESWHSYPIYQRDQRCSSDSSKNILHTDHSGPTPRTPRATHPQIRSSASFGRRLRSDRYSLRSANMRWHPRRSGHLSRSGGDGTAYSSSLFVVPFLTGAVPCEAARILRQFERKR